MATMENAKGTKTVLKVGQIERPVILHTIVSEPGKLKDYAVAGPNGRALRRIDRAEAAPEEESAGGDVPVKAAPLATSELEARPVPVEDPGPEAPKNVGWESAVLDKRPSEPGRFRSVLIETPGEGETEDAMPEVTPEMMRRGLRLADGKFIDLTDQLTAIEQRTKLERMEVVATIDVGQVPRDAIVGSYYLSSDAGKQGPQDGPRVLRLLFESMRRVRRVCVVTWTARSRQKLGIIAPNPKRSNAIEVLSLAWAEDIRQPGDRQLAHMQAEVFEQEVDAFAELLLALHETKAEGLDSMRDEARSLREELEARALADDVEEFAVVAPVAEEAVSLSEQLEASLEAVKATR